MATIISPTMSEQFNAQATTMQAIVQDQYGSADVLHLRELQKPEVGDADVLLRVQAAGVHIGDWHVMTGEPRLMRIMGFGLRAPKARVRGMDVAGTVVSVGKNVTRFHAGDDVFGICHGSFAEYACARSDKLAAKPTNLTFEHAAAIPTSACTALQALRGPGEIRAGQRVLINGASGGIGLFAVQIAKSLGAEVTGVCSTPKMAMVHSIGADRVVDYITEDFTQSAQRYDLILDMVGNRSLSQLRRALTPRGTLVLVGGESGDRWIGALSRSVRALVVSPFVSQRLLPVLGSANIQDLEFLKELIEAGKVRPVVDRTYSMTEVPDAIRYLKTGHALGKIVIRVGGAAAAPEEMTVAGVASGTDTSRNESGLTPSTTTELRQKTTNS